VYPVQQGAAGVGHLFQMIETHGILVTDPFERHTGYVRPQNLMIQLKHSQTRVAMPWSCAIRSRPRCVSYLTELPVKGYPETMTGSNVKTISGSSSSNPAFAMKNLLISSKMPDHTIRLPGPA
jgi:hypothetical protein